MSDWAFITYIQNSTKKYKVKISIRVDIWTIIGGDQCNRNTNNKTSSTGELNNERETNTTITQIFVK